ncbi:hypothetical protein HZ992_18970 [Rhizobacter sp. AJA081-3]|uniref:hypothetical protein n=1 Tax=Rhizobacter sp. AJA081-3 TaxID=2753607 RepID=UPI001AE0430B|nr:hypothetical protein [Rhizobacter sp. AJA081-3]QTN22223.1 hypothetical protein HZ992_18970 [Rhizobacter sp. AJA081-3]
MPDAVAILLDAYAQAQPRRASGGIHAMAGFAYQAEVAIYRAVTCLVASNDFGEAGRVFVEALSDVAIRNDNGSLVLLQVKRTLTAAALDSAAEEMAAIEAVDATLAQPVRPSYGVVCQHRSIELDWARLPGSSLHVGLVNRLRLEGRLQLPQQLPNPRWQALAALWDCHSDPFGFLHFALDRIVHRRVDVGDAAACWEVLAERYQQGRVQAADCGHHLDVADVLIAEQAAQHLEVGKRVTWDRWRRGQYMPRPVLADDAARRALALREQAVQSSAAELSVYWLAGRSGAGKSVVLLNCASALVQAGHSVLWLKPEELEPALARIARGEGWATPDFLAVDDIFDPDARDRIDLGRISILVDEQGARDWPVLLTCGPSEFSDDFAEQSRFQGFSVHAHEVPLLDRAETERFVVWAAPHLGTSDPTVAADRWAGLALSQGAQGQGLIVSVATELASGDMRHFGQRFADRLRHHGDPFALRIRLCLAVNRLYLRAPAAWLSSEDRAHLEDINRDGDFALEAAEAGQDWLRLTHPHLSDAIYPHLLQPARPRLFADDLGDAFQRALAGGHDALAQRLLLTFSANGGHARAQRMQAVEEPRLAERCVQAWRAHPAGGDIRLQAGMRVSLACWPAALPWLDRPIDKLIADALRGIDQAEAQFAGLGWWPTWWNRLWSCHTDHTALVDWAESRLAGSAGAPEAAWSHVWEAVWRGTRGERRESMAIAARQWLSSQGHRADWHFVWKALRGASDADRPLLVNLLATALPHKDGGHWPHIWQEALLGPPEGQDLAGLIAQGCDWLGGREDKDQWAYVWEALLARTQTLPEGWTELSLVKLGCDWLGGREDKDQWGYVWQALLARTQTLPEGWTELSLVELGCDWLDGREDKDQWGYVWQALLTRTQTLPEGWTELSLVKLGCDWLGGREDKDQWGYVWEALLARTQTLPEGWTELSLVKQGCDWLGGREDKDQWAYVWEALLARTQTLPEGWTELSLVKLGCDWLGGREDKNQWAYVWEALLARTQTLPEGWTELSLVKQGCDWLGGREDKNQWAYVWEALLARAHTLPEGWGEQRLLSVGLMNAEGAANADLVLPILKAVLLSRGQLEVAEQRRADTLVVRWLPQLAELAPGPASHALEAMLDARMTALPGVHDAVRAWCTGHRSHRSWPLLLVKALTAWPEDQALLDLAAELALIVEAHPNAGWLHKAERILDPVEVGDSPPALRQLLLCIRGRKESPAWQEVNRWIDSGQEVTATVVAVGRQVVVELAGGMFAVLARPGSSLRVRDPVRVVVASANRVIDRVYVRRAVTRAELPCIGEVIECTINGFAQYGVFVRVNSVSGLILARELPADPQAWEQLLPIRSRWMLRITNHTARGFNGAIVDPPWALS